MSLIWNHTEQHTSLETTSQQQIGASVPLGRESPTTITHHFFLLALVLRGADQAAWSGSSISPDVTGLSSSDCRAAKWFCKGEVWPWAACLPQTGCGISCLSPAQPPWCYTVFSPPPAAQASAAGGPPPGPTFAGRFLPRRKGLGASCSLRPALRPVPSAAPSGQRCQPWLG